MQYNFESLLNDLHDAVYFLDRDRKITFWNKAAERITGYTADEVIGSKCSDNILVHVNEQGESLCQNKCPMAMAMESGQASADEVYLHHKDGHRVPVSIRVAPLRDNDDNIVGSIEMFSDNTRSQRMQSRIKDLEVLALLDPLTKISNRAHLQAEIEIRFHERNRYGLEFGILFLDLDHFKNINDGYGHDVGDRVLKMVADTLLSTARPFDLFGRWGGEEFLGIIRNVNLESLINIGERCRVLIEKSYIAVGEQFVNVTVSIGATVSKPGDTVDSIVKRADDLLYRSKEQGRNCLNAG